MKNRNIVIFALAGLLLVVSFILPGAVLAIRDSAVESRAEYVTMDEVELSLVSSLTAEEKLKIAGDTAATAIFLDSGVGMGEEEAAETALVALGFDSDWTVEEVSPRLLVSGDGKSFVLWEAVLVSDSASATLMLDDETGALLGYTLRSGDTFRELGPTDPAAEDAYLSGTYDYYAVTAPSAEEYLELSEAVLGPAGLEPEGVIYSATGVLVSVENSDLAIRITVTGEDGSGIRLNMG